MPRQTHARPVILGTALALVLSLPAAPALAAAWGGTIASVSTKRIFVNTSKGKKEFPVPATAQVVLDGRRTPLVLLKPGQRVSVFTRSGRVYRVNARSVAAKPPRVRGPRRPVIRPAGPDPRTTEEPATNWPQFRGPRRDNRSPDTGLLTEWPAGGPREVWKHDGLGEAFSSVAVADGKVFTMGSDGDREVLIALDWQDPRKVHWTRVTGNFYRNGFGNGARSTPTVDGDRVYALGANGDLVCADVDTGRALWRKNVLRDFGARNISWGISESVLIDGDRLICTPGGPNATMVALDEQTGRTVWRSAVPGDPQAAYASPIVCNVGGVRQYVNFTDDSVIGVRAEDGRFLWRDSASANGTANCSTPLFHEGHVFSASGYGTGGAMVELTSTRGTTTSKLVYRCKAMVNQHGGMVIDGHHLYGTNESTLLCVDLRDGRVVWRERGVGKGSLTWADGHLYVVGEGGDVALVKATPDGYEEKGRFRFPHRSRSRLWPHPVVVNGRLIIRDNDTLVMYDVKAE